MLCGLPFETTLWNPVVLDSLKGEESLPEPKESIVSLHTRNSSNGILLTWGEVPQDLHDDSRTWQFKSRSPARGRDFYTDEVQAIVLPVLSRDIRKAHVPPMAISSSQAVPCSTDQGRPNVVKAVTGPNSTVEQDLSGTYYMFS